MIDANNEKIKIDKFAFSHDNLHKAEQIISKYPPSRKQSAVLPLLDLAQRQNDRWLSQSAMEYVADYIGISYVKILEIASFYSMFNLKPVGKYHLQVCTTTPCHLRGAGRLLSDLENLLQIKCGQTTSDGTFSLASVQCLGACINAPLLQCNDDYHENITDAKGLIAQISANLHHQTK